MLTPTEPLSFRKSSYSSPQNCVEVADLPGAAAIRDSMYPERGHLTFDAPEWGALIASVRRGEL